MRALADTWPILSPATRGLDSAPPATFNSGRLHWLDPSSRQDCWLHRDRSQGRTVRKRPVGIRTPTFAHWRWMLPTYTIRSIECSLP
eukprot:412245-Prymnesium_polylepis.1